MLSSRSLEEVDLSEDLHMHSTFSDGRNTLEEMVRAAQRAGLRRICFSDHVRVDTHWLSSYVDAVASVRDRGQIEVLCGVEAKILDASGRLDLPPCPAGVQALLVADHRLPWGSDCLSPRAALRLLERSEASPLDIFESLVCATVGAAEKAASLGRNRLVIIAHLFSFLPKIGLSEEEVPYPLLDRLAAGLGARRAVVEISERWRCPGPRTLSALEAGGVRFCASTDSHSAETVGRYRWVARTLAQARTLQRVRVSGRAVR
ncbi:MAG: PHP domain-containing protein [Acidobacteriota bacterium]